MDKITIYQFTDPVCIWCWGNEPVMRAIDYLYGDKVNVDFIMGGLVEDIMTVFDLKGSKELILKNADELILNGWREASARHGMPVKTDHFALFSEQQPSSYPQNIAYEAAKRQNPEAAKRLLRLIREATFTRSLCTARIDVLISLATEVGLDIDEFVNEYTIGNAQGDFIQDRMKCRRNGITGFPSYLIKNDHTSIILGGYQNLGTFHTVIRRLSGGKIKPRKAGPSQANVAEFVKRYTTVYPVEIETAFGLNKEQTDAIIGELVQNGKINAEAVGNGQRLTAVTALQPKKASVDNTAEAKSGSATKSMKSKTNAESVKDKVTAKTDDAEVKAAKVTAATTKATADMSKQASTDSANRSKSAVKEKSTTKV